MVPSTISMLVREPARTLSAEDALAHRDTPRFASRVSREPHPGKSRVTRHRDPPSCPSVSSSRAPGAPGRRGYAAARAMVAERSPDAPVRSLARLPVEAVRRAWGRPLTRRASRAIRKPVARPARLPRQHGRRSPLARPGISGTKRHSALRRYPRTASWPLRRGVNPRRLWRKASPLRQAAVRADPAYPPPVHAADLFSGPPA